jgi:hypothetical protein
MDGELNLFIRTYLLSTIKKWQRDNDVRRKKKFKTNYRF